jgi:hypothetical protein
MYCRARERIAMLNLQLLLKHLDLPRRSPPVGIAQERLQEVKILHLVERKKDYSKELQAD